MKVNKKHIIVWASIAIVLALLVLVWIKTPYLFILKSVFRPNGWTAMEKHLESRYNENFTMVEGSDIYSAPGELNLDPTKGTYSAKYKCESLPYYSVSCGAQLDSNRCTYSCWDDYEDQLARYKYRAVMIENIKGIFPDGSYVWLEYSSANKNEPSGGYYVSVFVEDMTSREAREALRKLKELNASQGLYPKVSVRKSLTSKETMHNLMTVEPNNFTAVDQDWNVEIAGYQ